MKKISLLLVFVMLVSCLCNVTFAYGEEITVNYSNDFENVEPVNTINVGSDVAAKLEGSRFVIFPVEIEEGGVYDVYVTAAGSEEGGKVNAQFYPLSVDKTEISAATGNVASIDSYTKTFIREEVLSAGKHNLRISNVSGTNYILSVTLVKKAEKETYLLYAPKVLNGGPVPSGTATVSGAYAWCWEHGTDFVGGTTLTFKMNVLTSGKYDMYLCAGSDGADYTIKVNGETVHSDNWASANHSVFKKELLGNVILPSGEVSVSITCEGSDAKVLYLNHIDFVLVDSTVEVEEITADGVAIDDEIAVNADVIKVKFNDDINVSDAVAENVSLASGEENIPLIITAEGDTITIALTKTLIKGNSYTLKIKDIYDKDGILSSGEVEYVFEAGEESAANASISLETSSLVDGKITASGYVKSSVGYSIAGRKVMLCYKDSDSILKEAETNSNGKYVIEYDLPQDAEVGMLDFVVKTQYSNEKAAFSVLYVTKEAEENFLQSLSDATTASQVKTLFEENEDILSVDISEDLASISSEGSEKVFEGLVGKEINSIDDLRNKYYKRVTMLKITEADEADLAILLSNNAIINQLGIDENLLSDISSYEDEYIAKIMPLEALDDENEFAQNLLSILNDCALLKYGKSDVDLSASDKTIFLTQEAKIDIEANDELLEVGKINLVIECDDEEMAESASFVSSEATVASYFEDGKLYVELTPLTSNVKKIGTLKITGNNHGNYNVTLSGDVLYDNGLTYDLKSAVNEKTISIFVLNELPSETTTKFSPEFFKSEEVEIIMGDTTPVGIIKGSEYIHFPITVNKSGLYEIYAEIFCSSDDGGKIKAQTSVEVAEGVDVSKTNGTVTNVDSYEKYLLRTEYLSVGTHRVKISNVSGVNAIYSVTALKTEDKEVYRKYAENTYETEIPGVNISGTYATVYDDGTMYVGGTTITFDIDAQNSGFYDLYLAASAANGANLNVTVNDSKSIDTFWQTPSFVELKKEYLGTVSLKEGKNTVAVTCVGADTVTALINSIDLILNSKTLDVKNVFADKTDLMNDDAPVSTDVFEVVYNADIDTSSVTNENVKLLADGNEMPINVSASNNEITVSLKQSLISGEEYKLCIDGVKDESGLITADLYEISFSACDSYEANALVELGKTKLKNENLTVEGVIKSSQDLGISGRKVMLYKADDLTTSIAEVLSGKDGAFIINYTMPLNSASGMHNFVIKTEYGKSDVAFSNIYVTSEQENAFLSSLKATSTKDEVEALLNDSEEILSIDIENDFDRISADGKETVFANICGADMKSIEDARNKYYSQIAMIRVAEAETADYVVELISDIEFCKNLGLNRDKLNDISENIDEFADELKDIKAQKDETQYMLLASALLDEYVLEKFDKINCYINAENQKIYLGQVAEIDFISSSELEDVKEINIVISCDDAVALKNAEYESAKGTNAVSSYSNGKLNVKITSTSGKIKDLGTLKIEGVNVGTIEFEAKGNVVYDLETLYDVVSVLNEKSFEVNVTKNTNKDTGGASGGSSGSSSGGLGGIKEEAKTEKFEFKDIDSVVWAKDSIEYLLNYGVISESDDANFRPNDSVKREEFVKMIVVALGVYDSKATTDLKDVDSSKWCYQYVASAQKLGLVKGNDKGAFGVGEEITREDMAVIISRALEILGFENDGEISEIFADDAQISGYAKDAVYMMKELGLINGMGDGNFAPKSTATRAQTAKMIFEMMKAVGK